MSDPAPQTDRRKTVHRDPHAENGGRSRRNDGRHHEVLDDPPAAPTSQGTTAEDPDTGSRGKRRTRFTPSGVADAERASADGRGGRRRDGRHEEANVDPPSQPSNLGDTSGTDRQDHAARWAPSAEGDPDSERRSQRCRRGRPSGVHHEDAHQADSPIGPIHATPSARLWRAERTGGLRATPAEEHEAARMGDPPTRDDDTGRGVGTDISLDGDPARQDGGEGSGGRGVGTVPVAEDPPERRRRDGRGGRDRGRASLVCRTAHTLMLLALVGTALSPALPQHHDDGHAETVEVHEASLGSGLVALWALAVQGWHALAAPELCDDCNLDVDDGCRCVYYSGDGACPGPRSGDPDDPACQF